MKHIVIINFIASIINFQFEKQNINIIIVVIFQPVTVY